MANNQTLKAYEAWLEKRNSWKSKFMKDINPIQLLALFGAFFLAWYMLKNLGPQSKWYIIGLAVIIVIIILKPNKPEELEPIPEDMIKVLAKIQLDRKIGYDTELPTGCEIQMGLECAIQWQGEWGQAFVPWKWGVFFSVKYPNGLVKDFLCLLHPYRGYITGIKPMRYGYDDKWLNDLKVLMPSMFKTDGAPPSSGFTVSK